MRAEKLLKKKYSMDLPSLKPGGTYNLTAKTGNLIYVSGQIPKRENGELLFKGRVGQELSIEDGQKAACYAMLNCLGALKGFLEDLDKIKQVVQVIGYVRSADGFGEQTLVMNGASQMLLDIFGDRGGHTRLALGVNELPKGAPVEIQCIVEV